MRSPPVNFIKFVLRIRTAAEILRLQRLRKISANIKQGTGSEFVGRISLQKCASAYSTALTMVSSTFLASPNTIMVLSM